MPENHSKSKNNDLAKIISEETKRKELVDPDYGLPPIERNINKIAEILGVTILGSIVTIVFVNACMRYFLNQSLIWAEEVIIRLIPWLAMFGLFLAARRQSMIRIEYFFDKLSPTIKRHVAIFSDLWCSIILAYIGVYGLKYVFAFGSDTMPYLGFPKGLSTSAIFFGGVTASIVFLRRILLKWKAR